MEREIPLRGGRTTTGVVRIGNTVRRPIEGRASLTHELLNHLERRGFSGAAEISRDRRCGPQKFILLTYLATVPSELEHFTDAQLMGATRLLRQLHDATQDYSAEARVRGPVPRRPQAPATACLLRGCQERSSILMTRIRVHDSRTSDMQRGFGSTSAMTNSHQIDKANRWPPSSSATAWAPQMPSRPSFRRKPRSQSAQPLPAFATGRTTVVPGLSATAKSSWRPVAGRRRDGPQ